MLRKRTFAQSQSSPPDLTQLLLKEKGTFMIKRAETHQRNKMIDLASPKIRQTNTVCP